MTNDLEERVKALEEKVDKIIDNINHNAGLMHKVAKRNEWIRNAPIAELDRVNKTGIWPEGLQ